MKSAALVLVAAIGITAAYQPYFLGHVANVTVQQGRDTMLSCSVENLGAYKVAWVRVETQTILTIHRTVITRNPRIQLSHVGQRVWKLHISNVTHTDRGDYMCQINTDPMVAQLGHVQVVVPPVISDSGSSTDMVVREGIDVKLRCLASGYPPPRVQWRREDGAAIHRLSNTEGETLTIERVSRLHMGAYLCIAHNGVLPSVSKRMYLKVHFAPVMLVSSQLESAYIGQRRKQLECETEAHPRSINYWTNQHDELITTGDKYSTQHSETALYKVSMKLVIKDIRASDFGRYKCVAKNSFGQVDGVITLDESNSGDDVITDIVEYEDNLHQSPNDIADDDDYAIKQPFWPTENDAYNSRKSHNISFKAPTKKGEGRHRGRISWRNIAASTASTGTMRATILLACVAIHCHGYAALS